MHVSFPSGTLALQPVETFLREGRRGASGCLSTHILWTFALDGERRRGLTLERRCSSDEARATASQPRAERRGSERDELPGLGHMRVTWSGAVSVRLGQHQRTPVGTRAVAVFGARPAFRGASQKLKHICRFSRCMGGSLSVLGHSRTNISSQRQSLETQRDQESRVIYIVVWCIR